MADVWSGSWGASWGVSWGQAAGAGIADPAAATRLFSMMDFCRVGHPALPIPNGSFSAADRLALLWLYNGLGGAVDPGAATFQRRRGFMKNVGRLMNT